MAKIKHGYDFSRVISMGGKIEFLYNMNMLATEELLGLIEANAKC